MSLNEISAMFRKVQAAFGKLDILVSNARPEAAAFFYPPTDVTLEQWDAAFDSQAKAFLVGVREAASLMGDGGRILAITYAQGSRDAHRLRHRIGNRGVSALGRRDANYPPRSPACPTVAAMPTRYSSARAPRWSYGAKNRAAVK
jgi:NAD(P)-dependent dehydrogenase (short-subunit alcohol dehydrogenase family)